MTKKKKLILFMDQFIISVNSKQDDINNTTTAHNDRAFCTYEPSQPPI